MRLCEIESIVSSLREARGLSDVERAFEALVDFENGERYILGIRVASSLIRPADVIVSNVLDEFVEKNGLLTDAETAVLLDHCYSRTTPLSWVLEDIGSSRKSEGFKSLMGRLGFYTGLSFPLRGAFGVSGVLMLVSTVRHPVEKFFNGGERSAVLQLCGNFACEALCNLLWNKGALNVCDPLTEREVECLLWAAEGKTSGELCAILGVSESTVNFHLNNATQKLKAVNRQHAVAKAVLWGILKPGLA